jgi:ATP-dependent DNA ligase
MSATKRELGFLNKGTNTYEFPTLRKVRDDGKTQQWTIYIRLIKEGSRKPEETKKQNWNLFEEDQVEIKDEYLDDNAPLPEGIIAQLWTEGGIEGMRISRSPATYPDEKKKGKKNVLHQALVLARGKYLKKQEEGGTSNGTSIGGGMFFPMLARNFKDVKELSYPVYVQPKLDGLRCLAYLPVEPSWKTTFEDIVLYSRQKKEFPNNASIRKIKEVLLPILINNYKDGESIVLDGELYRHGDKLQSINSAVRGSGTDEEAEYHVYDVFYPSYTDETFTHRYNLLYYILEKIDTPLQLVPTHLIPNEKEHDILYHSYIRKGYEGTIIRNPNGGYMKSSTNKSSKLRTNNLLKRKEVFDGEFEIIGFTQGKMGRDIGAIVWICETQEHQTFNVVPNIPYDKRYEIYQECLVDFVTKYKHRKLLVEYRSLSQDNVPQHGRGIGFRDYL